MIFIPHSNHQTQYFQYQIIMPQLKQYLSWELMKWVSLGGVAIGASYIAYKLIANSQSSKKQTPVFSQKNPEYQTHKTEYSDYYFDKNLQIQLLEEKLPENLTLEDIYLQSPTIVRDQFIKYTKQIRRRRRLIRKTNQQAYIDLILNYENQIQELLSRSRLELIEFLNIHPDDLTEMEESYDEIEDLHELQKKSEGILKKQILNYGVIKPIGQEKLQAILDDQIAFVKNKMYQRIKKKLEMEISLTQNQILAIVKALSDDIIYEKYGYQPQDIDRKINQESVDTGERDRCQSILQADVIDFNFESLNSSRLEIESNCDQDFQKSIPTNRNTNKSKEQQEDIEQLFTPFL